VIISVLCVVTAVNCVVVVQQHSGDTSVQAVWLVTSATSRQVHHNCCSTVAGQTDYRSPTSLCGLYCAYWCANKLGLLWL